MKYDPQKIPYARNLAATSIEFANSFETLQEKTSPDYQAKIQSPETYRRWAMDPNTQHCHFSGTIGENPNARVSNQNPPEFSVAFVADFDDTFDREILSKKIARAKYPPTYISKTKSNRLRAVWEFESPARFSGDASLAREFFRVLGKHLKLSNFYTGLDIKSYEPTQIYDIGSNWERTGAKLPPPIITDVLFEAINSNKKYHEASQIPWEAIRDEVSRKYGDKVRLHRNAAFSPGERCNAFWLDGINDSAAYIFEAGIYSYSQNRFAHWDEILGETFVNEFRAATRDNVTKDWFVCDSVIYEVIGDRVHKRGREWFGDFLEVTGVQKKDKSGYLQFLRQSKSVDAVGPVVYGAQPVAKSGGSRILNTSRIRLTQPEPGEFDAWTELLAHLFKNDDESRFHILRWIQHAYESARLVSLGKPGTRGLALFLCGGKGSGKSLLSSAISEGIFGGHSDPEDWFMGMTPFNEELFEKFIWNLDDPVSMSGGSKARRQFTNRVKKAVAASSATVTAKGRKSFDTKWFGRIIASCNDDPDSIQALPDSKGAAEDKTLILSTTDQPFLPPLDFRDRLFEQTPAFLYWLTTELEFPETWADAFLGADRTGGRFGQLAYTTPEISQKLDGADIDGEFLDHLRTAADEAGYGGAIEMKPAQMLEIPGVKDFFSSPQSLGLALRRLRIKHPDVVLAPERANNHSRCYKILGYEAESDAFGGPF